MATLRRVIVFWLGIWVIIMAVIDDPVRIFSLLAGLLLIGVVTWDQIEAILRRRNGNHDRPES